jgi:hypothetical protein
MGTWRKMFGPSKEEIWRQLTTEINARYVPGSFWKGDKVQATHGEWTLTLDTYAISTGRTTMVFTRMRAPYVNPDGFRFTVYKKGIFTDLAKRFGMQDVEVGDEAFDRDFVIQGTDESKLRELFSNPKIRALLAEKPELNLTVKDDEGWFGPNFPDGVDELCFGVPGIIKDAGQLKRLYALFAETLDQLCRMGAAYAKGPDVEL